MTLPLDSTIDSMIWIEFHGDRRLHFKRESLFWNRNNKQNEKKRKKKEKVESDFSNYAAVCLLRAAVS